MCVTRWRGSIKSSTSPMPTVLWRSRTSRKLRNTTTSTSRKRHGTTWAFILKKRDEEIERPPPSFEFRNSHDPATNSRFVHLSYLGDCLPTARGDEYESNCCPPIWRPGSAQVRGLS